MPVRYLIRIKSQLYMRKSYENSKKIMVGRIRTGDLLSLLHEVSNLNYSSVRLNGVTGYSRMVLVMSICSRMSVRTHANRRSFQLV